MSSTLPLFHFLVDVDSSFNLTLFMTSSDFRCDYSYDQDSILENFHLSFLGFPQ